MALDLDALLAALERGERRAVARLLTVVEDGTPEQLRRVIGALHPRGGHARVLGISGSPGVGKSTLTDRLAAALRAKGRSVAVLAVDPSSPFTGGALLGDRVRMQGHHADPGVFIRSMASRGHLGGLSVATPQAVVVLDAAGFDDVLIETVGVGQSEVEITATADTTIIALAPGMGDGIQAAKAGILEVADVFAINKADAGGAGKLQAELEGMLELGHDLGAEMPWWPPIVRTVAVRDEGIAELLDAIERHTAALATSGLGAARRRDRARHLVRELALEETRRSFARLEAGEDALVDQLAARVERREVDPYAAADELLAATHAAG
ncbi:MAG: methylmalonyl Co-A mutase-associated GTPase MeaB [Nitriliruptoraceae bacterium]